MGTCLDLRNFVFRTVRTAPVEIDIAAVQVECFRSAQPRSGDQPEDRRIGRRTQSALGDQPRSGSNKVADLLL